MAKRLGPTSWIGFAGVTGIGIAIVAIVLGTGLFGRLEAGQQVLNATEPVFAPQQVVGARAGINAISVAVNAADPIVTAKGGAATEVPQLVAFVSEQTGLSQAQVLAALQQNFPHTTSLLLATPLSGVTAELPKLVALLSSVLKLPQAEVLTALQTSFPRIAQAVGALPKVTAGWDSVPGISGLTRFDGSPVTTVPGIRDYFSSDVIPVVEKRQQQFTNVNTLTPNIVFIPPLVLSVGALIIAFGGVMTFRAFRRRQHPLEAAWAWGVVGVVGLVVVAVLCTLRLFVSLDSADMLIKDLRPVFTQQRIQADTPAIAMVSTVVDLLDPITTAKGGAAAEVPKLIAFVSEQSGLPQAAVVAALQKTVPQTTALLLALPLSAVSAELPKLVGFLETTLKVTPAQLNQALTANFPRLAQSIANLPTLTAAWDNLPGAPGFTRVDGTPITNVTGVRDYFGADVIPTLGAQRLHFDRLDESWPAGVFAPLLLAIALVATALGFTQAFRYQYDPRTKTGQTTASRDTGAVAGV